jgi:hypothetical protein
MRYKVRLITPEEIVHLETSLITIAKNKRKVTYYSNYMSNLTLII